MVSAENTDETCRINYELLIIDFGFEFKKEIHHETGGYRERGQNGPGRI